MSQAVSTDSPFGSKGNFERYREFLSETLGIQQPTTFLITMLNTLLGHDAFTRKIEGLEDFVSMLQLLSYDKVMEFHKRLQEGPNLAQVYLSGNLVEDTRIESICE
jgi:hypothetical protein